VAGRIKMPLGKEVGLGPGDFVGLLYEDTAPLPMKGAWLSHVNHLNFGGHNHIPGTADRLMLHVT